MRWGQRRPQVRLGSLGRPAGARVRRACCLSMLLALILLHITTNTVVRSFERTSPLPCLALPAMSRATLCTLPPLLLARAWRSPAPFHPPLAAFICAARAIVKPAQLCSRCTSPSEGPSAPACHPSALPPASNGNRSEQWIGSARLRRGRAHISRHPVAAAAHRSLAGAACRPLRLPLTAYYSCSTLPVVPAAKALISGGHHSTRRRSMAAADLDRQLHRAASTGDLAAVRAALAAGADPDALVESALGGCARRWQGVSPARPQPS